MLGGGPGLVGRRASGINPLAPVATVAPAVTPTTGGVTTLFTCDDGTWTNAPVSFAHQWRRAGIPIGGETATTYTAVSADQGLDIECAVIATNALGLIGAAASNAVSIPAAGTPGQYDFSNPDNSGLI